MRENRVSEGESMKDENYTATITYYEDAHDGPGWYYIDDVYPDEGSVGAFNSCSEAAEHAEATGYTVRE